MLEMVSSAAAEVKPMSTGRDRKRITNPRCSQPMTSSSRPDMSVSEKTAAA